MFLRLLYALGTPSGANCKYMSGSRTEHNTTYMYLKYLDIWLDYFSVFAHCPRFTPSNIYQTVAL